MPAPFEPTASSSILLAEGSLQHWPKFFPGGADSIARYASLVILTDETVYDLYASTLHATLEHYQLRAHFIVIPSGEPYKTIFTAASCWEDLLNKGCGRDTLLICVGGGTVTDLGGFVASTYMRGIDVLHIPTTLMGMVDASLGGKTGVNSPSGKTVVGTFYSPFCVLIDPTLLETLPQRSLLSGVAEMIKYAVIGHLELLDWLQCHRAEDLCLAPSLLTTPIQMSYQMKMSFVEADPKDTLHRRALLNFGHTFAHALETLSGYTQYLHGEAVAIGMSCASFLSHEMGLASLDFATRLQSLCQTYHLPTKLPHGIDLEAIVKVMRRDKKATKRAFVCILGSDFGHLQVVDNIKEEVILSALQKKQHFDSCHLPEAVLHG